jgi:hypothetical protein
MGNDEDWVMRPVVEGMCLYESIKNCTLDLGDIARMNQALEVRDRNDYLRRKAEVKD